MFSPRDAEHHLRSQLHISYLFFSGKSEDVGLCEGHQLSLRKHVSTVHHSCSMRKFAIISFMVIYIANDSRGTKERLVTADAS